jgi:hypothetical protein
VKKPIIAQIGVFTQRSIFNTIKSARGMLRNLNTFEAGGSNADSVPHKKGDMRRHVIQMAAEGVLILERAEGAK